MNNYIMSSRNTTLRKDSKRSSTVKVQENFSAISGVIDEIISYFPNYFQWCINQFRWYINKVLEGDLFYLVYLFGIFIIIKMYIRGKVIPQQELYFESQQS